MTELWLQVVGLGEDGPEGLKPAARAAVEAAETIFGGERHHALTEGLAPKAERVRWPSPFDALLGRLAEMRGRRTVVLVSGDPLWRSAGSRVVEAFPEAIVHPHVSSYQLAASRMLWPLEGCETLTIHGRAAAAVLPWVRPGARLLALAAGSDSARELGALLTRAGWGRSRVTALAHLDGPRESWAEARAEDWGAGRIEPPADLHVLAVECEAAEGTAPLPRIPGLPDAAFAHDGVMTKREVRAATLAKLSPFPGQMLWDVGCGCGSVAVEWMRAAREARAVGIEPRADRRTLAAANAQTLGVPGLEIREGRAPEALAGLPAPDAVFLGGGLSEAAVEAAWDALRPFGRMVANAVTLESEALLLGLHARMGGELVRIRTERAEPVGGMTGWRPAMTVTQWSLEKR